MKINFQFVTVLGSVGVNLAAANCRTDDLPRLDNFKSWDCSPSQALAAPGSIPWVTVGTRCYLECEEGFTPYSDRKRNYYICQNPNAQHPFGWRPNELNLSCKYDRKCKILRKMKFKNNFSCLLDSKIVE